MKPAIEVGSPQNACALVQMGAGISIVDEFSVRSWPANQIVVRPLANAPTLVANLVHLSLEPLSQLAESFIETLRQQLAMQGFALPHPPEPAITRS